MVDVGCLGSHGRTGTMLACICVMMGMRPGEAVRYVRANHCKEAIENAKQVDFVVQLADAVRGYQPTDPDDAADNVIVEAERGNCYKESLWSSYKTKAAGSTAASIAAEQYVQVYQGGEWQTVDPKDLADSEVPDSWLTTLVELGFPAPEPWTVLPCCGHEAQEHDTDSGMDVWWCDSMTEGITYCRCEDPVFEGTGSVTDMLDSDVH
jgi:hypothetical protein